MKEASLCPVEGHRHAPGSGQMYVLQPDNGPSRQSSPAALLDLVLAIVSRAFWALHYTVSHMAEKKTARNLMPASLLIGPKIAGPYFDASRETPCMAYPLGGRTFIVDRHGSLPIISRWTYRFHSATYTLFSLSPNFLM